MFEKQNISFYNYVQILLFYILVKGKLDGTIYSR